MYVVGLVFVQRSSYIDKGINYAAVHSKRRSLRRLLGSISRNSIRSWSSAGSDGGTDIAAAAVDGCCWPSDLA